MVYDTLVSEARGLSEDMMKQTIVFMRFLKSTMEKDESVLCQEEHTFHREKNPLAGGLVFIADDFDETPECFRELLSPFKIS